VNAKVAELGFALSRGESGKLRLTPRTAEGQPPSAAAVEVASNVAPPAPSAGLNMRAAIAAAPAKARGWFHSQPQAAENGKATLLPEVEKTGPKHGI
jgi:hypothetical protein